MSRDDIRETINKATEILPTLTIASSNSKIGEWDAGEDDYIIDPRGWLLGNTFCRRFVSALIADGGVGKTSLRIAQAIALASGKEITGEHVFQRCRVLVVSLEDDRDELRRRVNATLIHHDLKPSDVKGYLFLAAPKGLRLAEMKAGSPTVGELEVALQEVIEGNNIDLVILDPFVKSHGMEENSNNEIDFVCGLLASIAVKNNCAVDAPHHTNKSPAAAGDGNKSRGASAFKDAARLVYSLTPMSLEDAQTFGISEEERRSLVRVDSAKVNIAPPAITAQWFKLLGVHLNNQNEIYKHGDEVQAVECWVPPDIWRGIDAVGANVILDKLDAGLLDGRRYSDRGQVGEDQQAWRVVKNHYSQLTDMQAKEVIKTWVKRGVLRSDKYRDPIARKDRDGLFVEPTKRPTLEEDFNRRTEHD